MMPQGNDPVGGAVSGSPDISMGNAPQDPATKLGMVAMKLDPKVLGTLLMAALSKAGLSPDAKGLAQLATGDQPRPMIQTPSAQPGIIQ